MGGAPPALGGGRESYDVVTARALASLAVLAEYAAPLLRPDGVLVAWKGARDPAEERAGAAAAARLGMRVEEVRARGPVRGRRAPPPARPAQDRAHAGRVSAPPGNGAQAAAGLTAAT